MVLELWGWHAMSMALYVVSIAVVAYGLCIRNTNIYYRLFWWRYRRKRRWFADKHHRPRYVKIEATNEPHVFLWRNLIGPLKDRSTRVITSSPRSAYFNN